MPYDQLANCTVSERLDAPIDDTAPASRLIIDDLLTLRKTTAQPLRRRCHASATLSVL
jgi:hypothetical protein